MQLKNKGLNEWTFRGLFKTKAQLSRLVITKDDRILLPDYHDIEVKMEPLVKAVYLLFLKHPEEIIFIAEYRIENGFQIVARLCRLPKQEPQNISILCIAFIQRNLAISSIITRKIQKNDYLCN